MFIIYIVYKKRRLCEPIVYKKRRLCEPIYTYILQPKHRYIHNIQRGIIINSSYAAVLCKENLQIFATLSQLFANVS